MKPYILFTLAIMSSLFCSAQQFTFNQGGASSSNYYQELPYETVNGKLFITVNIAGKNHKFLFDTGAPSAINQELADAIKAPVINREKIMDAFGGEGSTTVVELPELKLGTVVFQHTPALTLIPDFYKCWGVEGVIGSHLFRNSIVRIDQARHIITFTDNSKKLELRDQNSLEMIKGGNQSDPRIKISIADKASIILGFDTGDNNLIRMCDELVSQLKEPPGLYEIVAKGYGASNYSAAGLQKSADKQLIKFPFITISGCRFDNVITENNKTGLPGIGSKILDYGIVTLDFIHDKFYFDVNTPRYDVNEKQWPFQPSIINDQLVIGTVWDKGKNLVKQGEQIIKINGADYSHVTICDMAIAPSPLAGKTTAILTIRDDKGNVRKITINKE